MRLLTLNTHSLIERDYEKKCDVFVREILALRPDLIALQEVNQTAVAKAVTTPPMGYIPCVEAPPIREDNHAMRMVSRLSEAGIDYNFAWLPIKNGFDQYEEGVAILSRSPILKTYQCHVSRADDPLNWRTRKLLGVSIASHPHVRFYSVHYGWWCDGEESFAYQWQATLAHIRDLPDVILMGDFNNPAEVRGEGYDSVAASGFCDVYTQAPVREGEVTVPTGDGSIDGWHGRAIPRGGMRIDHIWMSVPHPVGACRVVFDGVRGDPVSDHYGVMADVEIPQE